MSKSRVHVFDSRGIYNVAARIRHARLQITTKMQHFMAKMLKTFWGQPPPKTPRQWGEGHSLHIPHPFSALLRRSGPPSYYFLFRPLLILLQGAQIGAGG